MTPFTTLRLDASPCSRSTTSTPIRSSRRASSRAPTRRASRERLFADWRYAARAFRSSRPRRRARRSCSPARTSAAARRASTRRGRSSTGASARSSRASFADIFRQNALKNGLLPVALGDADHARVLAARTANPKLELHVDLPSQRLSIVGDPSASFEFPIDPFAKHCLAQRRRRARLHPLVRGSDRGP